MNDYQLLLARHGGYFITFWSYFDQRETAEKFVNEVINPRLIMKKLQGD